MKTFTAAHNTNHIVNAIRYQSYKGASGGAVG
jgi:hypothetical protein